MTKGRSAAWMAKTIPAAADGQEHIPPYGRPSLSIQSIANASRYNVLRDKGRCRTDEVKNAASGDES